MSTRPIDITSDDTKTESMDISFIFNYPILTNQSFKARSISSDSTLGLNGLQVSLESITTKKVVLLNNNSYYFDSFYISRGADDAGTEYGYSIVIKNKSITDSNSNLYIIIPFDDNEDSMKDTPSDFSTLKSSINTYSNEISGNTNYINIGNLDLNLNSIINIDDTFYKYTINNDTIISLISGPVSLNMSDSSFSQFFKDIQTPIASDFKAGLVSESNNFPINMDLNVLGFQDDIYIDCSPVGSGTENEIIKPKKVFSIKPLINVDNIGDAGNALLFLFILIIIGVCCYFTVKYVTRKEDSIIKFMKDTANREEFTLESMKNNMTQNISNSLIFVGSAVVVLLFMMITISILFTLSNPTKKSIISNKILSNVGIMLGSLVLLCFIIFMGLPQLPQAINGLQRMTLTESKNIIKIMGVVLICAIIGSIIWFFVSLFQESIFSKISTVQKAIFITTSILLIVIFMGFKWESVKGLADYLK
jgi:hypothetical protein